MLSNICFIGKERLLKYKKKGKKQICCFLGGKMKKKNDGGFIHIIVYLLIFLVFSVTLYACLEILGLIDVPEEYSVTKWISEHFDSQSQNEVEENEKGSVFENIYKNVRIQIEGETNTSTSNVNVPVIEGYETSEKSSYKIQNSSNFLYYDQLDEYAKIIYKELEKNLDNMKSGTYNVQFGTTFNDLLHTDGGEEKLNESFQLAVNALNFDNPETFFIDIPKIYLLTEITTKLWNTTYSVEIGCKDGDSYLNSSFVNRDSVNQAIEQVRNERKMIISKAYGSDEDKVRLVHNYLIEKLDYDSTISKDNIYNIYGALINKCTVCEGYARSFKYLMDELNIPCLIACGTAINSSGENESHAWNYVQLNGNWYAVDVTWDDPIIVGNGYIDSSIKYKYYLKGSEEFFTNHTEKGDIVGDSNFKYPVLSVTNY